MKLDENTEMAKEDHKQDPGNRGIWGTYFSGIIGKAFEENLSARGEVVSIINIATRRYFFIIEFERKGHNFRK